MFRVNTAGGAVLGLLLVFLIGHEACLAFVSPPLRGCHISQQYRVKRGAALRMQAAEVSEEVERVARQIKRDLLDLVIILLCRMSIRASNYVFFSSLS